MVSRGLRGERKWKVTANGYGVSLGDDEYVLKSDGDDVCTTL